MRRSDLLDREIRRQYVVSDVGRCDSCVQHLREGRERRGFYGTWCVHGFLLG